MPDYFFMKLVRLIRISFILAGLWTWKSIGQTNNIRMNIEYGTDNQELQDLMNFENIDYFKVYYVGPSLKGKDYSLVVKTMWRGKLTQVDTLLDSGKNKLIKPLASDTLPFRVTAKKIEEDSLKINFRFKNFGIERRYKATKSNDYSLRATGSKIPIAPEQEFAAFVYILPYIKNGWKMYCEVDNSSEEVENWGDIYGLEHYLIFEMKFY